MQIVRANRRDFRVLYVLVALGLSSCAKMGAPPGGPEDKTGPLLVSNYPEVNAVNVPRSMVARLEFSEPVNRSSVEAALFLSPDPLQRLRYRWRGQILELVYLDELEEDRTYVISVGNQAKDLRGNPTGETFTIAFSTGSRIDRGRVEGWVTDQETPQGVSIWAYVPPTESGIDPSSKSPEYRIQPDETGRFRLGYMRAGAYRVFAIVDRDRNGLWNPSVEPIGLPPWDVSVTDTTVSWVSFKLAIQDTVPPALRSVKEVHPFEIQLRTTAPVDTLSAVFVSQAGDTTHALDEYADVEESDTWHVFTEERLAAGKWLATAAGTSQFGEMWADTESLEVRDRADTTRPKILSSDPPIKGRARNVLPDLTLEYAEPVVLDSTGLADAYLIDPDRDSVTVRFQQQTPRIVHVIPDSAFIPGNYSLTLNGAAIRDMSGNDFGDSTMELRFGFYTLDSLGSLRIKFSASSHRYVLDLFAVKGHERIETRVITAPTDVVYADLPAGKYTLEIIRDINSDSSYTFGRMAPWQFSEPYIVPPDTISIRAKWEQEISVTWPESP